MFTHTRSTWCRNRGSRARTHSDGAAIALAHEAVGEKRVGRRVLTRGDVKGAGNVVQSMGKGDCGLSRSGSLLGRCVVYR